MHTGQKIRINYSDDPDKISKAITDLYINNPVDDGDDEYEYCPKCGQWVWSCSQLPCPGDKDEQR